MSDTQINDGGPAFPSETEWGVTLRDYFAAAALQGNLAVGCYEGKDAWDKAAKDAYRLADAMLKAREDKPCIKQLKTKSCIYCMKVKCECSDFDVSADMGAKG